MAQLRYSPIVVKQFVLFEVTVQTVAVPQLWERSMLPPLYEAIIPAPATVDAAETPAPMATVKTCLLYTSRCV